MDWRCGKTRRGWQGSVFPVQHALARVAVAVVIEAMHEEVTAAVVEVTAAQLGEVVEELLVIAMIGMIVGVAMTRTTETVVVIIAMTAALALEIAGVSATSVAVTAGATNTVATVAVIGATEVTTAMATVAGIRAFAATTKELVTMVIGATELAIVGTVVVTVVATNVEMTVEAAATTEAEVVAVAIGIEAIAMIGVVIEMIATGTVDETEEVIVEGTVVPAATTVIDHIGAAVVIEGADDAIATYCLLVSYAFMRIYAE